MILSTFVHGLEKNCQFIYSVAGKGFASFWALGHCLDVLRSTIHIHSAFHLFHMHALRASNATHALEVHLHIYSPLFVLFVAEYPTFFTVTKVNNAHI